MFMIFKNKRPAGSKKYLTYESARQAVRKRLRKMSTFRWHRQPINIGGYGYTIQKVV